MIAVIERGTGYTIANNGHTLHVSFAEADELSAALNETVRAKRPKAVTPAKYAARARPPIMRYATGTAK